MESTCPVCQKSVLPTALLTHVNQCLAKVSATFFRELFVIVCFCFNRQMLQKISKLFALLLHLNTSEILSPHRRGKYPRLFPQILPSLLVQNVVPQVALVSSLRHQHHYRKSIRGKLVKARLQALPRRSSKRSSNPPKILCLNYSIPFRIQTGFRFLVLAKKSAGLWQMQLD